MKTLDIALKDIFPYENNPRNNDNAVDAVANSIKEFGFQQPLVLDKNNVIIVGHTRYKAAKKLGLKSVPCVIAENLTDEQCKAYRLADNKVGELAEWNMDLLAIELDEIDFDMGEFGFDEIDDIEEPVKEQKEVELGEESYQIIIECADETDCEEKYNQLMELGIECRISTL
jgi:hypothetical protein